jgi:hypothetical protein
MYNPGKLAMHAVFFLLLTLVIAGLYHEIMIGASTPPDSQQASSHVDLLALANQNVNSPYPYPPAGQSTQRYLLDGKVREITSDYWLVDQYQIRWPDRLRPAAHTDLGTHLQLMVRPMSDGTYLVEEIINNELYMSR